MPRARRPLVCRGHEQQFARVKSYTYDAAGRTKTVASSAGTTTLAYDCESRVTSISGPGVSNTFSYNGLDTRVGKVDSGGTATYRRDGAGVTAPVLGDGAAVYTPGVSQRRSGATTYDLHDRLGTAARQTNSSAATTATRAYDAFGLLVASTGAPKGPFGFAGGSGYQEDGDSGLKLLGHRYYDPSTGRFLSRDPVKDGRNWYGYVDNNPVRWTDEKGLEKDEVVPIILRGIQHGKLPPGLAGRYKKDHDFKDKVHRDIGKAKKKRGSVKGKHNADLPEDQVIEIVKKRIPDDFDPPGTADEWEDNPRHVGSGPTIFGWPLPIGPFGPVFGPSPIGYPIWEPIPI